jgi:large subunit ribosomal protein L4
MNRKALAIALSGKARDKEVVVVDSLKLRELKTKSMRQAVDNLKLKGSILVGLSKSEALTSRASRNIPEVDSAVVENLNVFDILNHKYLVVSEEGIKSLEKRYEYTR